MRNAVCLSICTRRESVATARRATTIFSSMPLPFESFGDLPIDRTRVDPFDDENVAGVAMEARRTLSGARSCLRDIYLAKLEGLTPVDSGFELLRGGDLLPAASFGDELPRGGVCPASRVFKTLDAHLDLIELGGGHL
jgi:hypothetical protein